jgi:type II secretory pathway component PulK
MPSRAGWKPAPPRQDRPGYVIIAVLIVIVVLALAAYQFTELMSAEHRAAVRSADAVAARNNAISGVHYATAMLADPSSFYGDLQGDPTAEGAFPNDGFSLPNRSARFALVSVVNTGSGTWEQRYGAAIDEGGKLNLNALIALDPSGEVLAAALNTIAQLTNNPLLTSEVIDAIVDWLDADDDPRTNGAESSYYLTNPAGGYRAKNGPLNSLDELLLVKGVTPRLLYGNDRNRNGQADDGSSDPLDRGIADYLTVYGRELNLDSQGVLRENVNESEDLAGLYERLTARLGDDLATFIMGYKIFNVSTNSNNQQQQNVQAGTTADLKSAVQAQLDAGTATNRRRLKSLLDLRGARITLPKPAGAAQDAPTVVVDSPLNDPAQLPVLMAKLLDAATTTTIVEMTPRINVNTAPKEVLMALTSLGGSSSSSSTASSAASSAGLTESDIDAIITLRANQNPADPATLTGAWLLQQGGISPDNFKRIEKYITGRSMVYRIHSVGYFAEGGPVARVEAVIDTNQGYPRILYFRDMTDLDLPRGFDPPR